jgi:predicted transcriptional regulator
MVLDAMLAQLANVKAQYVKELMTVAVAPNKKVKTVSKGSVCPSANLESEEDVERYLSDMKQKLLEMLKDNDTVQII